MKKQNYFSPKDMLIIPPQVELPDTNFKTANYLSAVHSKLNQYNSRYVKPISKDEIKKLIFKE